MTRVNFKQILKPILLFFAVPLLMGYLAAYATINTQSFIHVRQPQMSPPLWFFPIVILVLYTLMGVSAYLVYKSKSYGRETPLYVWALQLIFCFFWAITFFSGGAYQLSLIWAIVLWALVMVMVIRFFRFRHAAGYLQIPYLLCTTFAIYLNFMVYLLN